MLDNPKIIYVNNDRKIGKDEPKRGSIDKPYRTIKYAISQIGDSGKYTISLQPTKPADIEHGQKIKYREGFLKCAKLTLKALRELTEK